MSTAATCQEGHVLSPDNIIQRKPTHTPTCRECNRLACGRRRAERAAKAGRTLAIGQYVLGADGTRYNQDRFWAKVDKSTSPDGCWLWTGNRSTGGYGHHRGGAHRFAYRVLVGPIPDGLELDHLCRIPLCVNPAHLEPVTPAENIRRRFALQTHCAQGHEYTPENTYRDNRQRRCKTCMADRQRRYRASLRAEVSA